MTDEVRQLVDRQAILDCVVNCARGMDRHDPELFASAYHPDALDDHGPYRGTAAGFIEHVNGSDDDEGVHGRLFRTHQHLVLNHFVELDGDEAHGETHFLFFGALRAAPTIKVTGGRYVDRFARRDGRWAIAARRVVMEWMTELPDTGDANAATLSAFTRGAWDRSDISYQRPLQVREG